MPSPTDLLYSPFMLLRGEKGMTVFSEMFEGEDLAPWESTSEILCAARHVRAWG